MTDRRARPGDHRRPGSLLAGAGVAASASIGLLAAVATVLGADLTPGVIAVAGVPALAGLAAGRVSAARRRSEQAVDAAAQVVTASLAVCSALAVVVLGTGRVPTAADGWSTGATVVTALLAVAAGRLLLGPARATAHRLTRGDRRAPRDVLRDFGDRATGSLDDDELLLQLVESLHASLVVSAAEVWTGGGGVVERVASLPDRPTDVVVLDPEGVRSLAATPVVGDAWLSLWLPELLAGREGRQVRVAPARHQGAVLGLVVVERDGAAERFDSDDDATLAELGRRLGVVLHNRALDSALAATLADLRRANTELRASRSRLVAAADEERRRIERDLHDGAQQHLVALAVHLRLLGDVMADDPGEVPALLSQLDHDIRRTIDEMRDLAHGIYPPLLRDAGLPEALRAAATRSPLDVEVRAGDVGRHPTEVEAALYFCCVEALQNAARHAPGSSVVVTIEEADGQLVASVSDDGPGFDPATVATGHGLQNSSDRLGAIGGTARWDSAPGSGTTMVAAVPLDHDRGGPDGAAVA